MKQQVIIRADGGTSIGMGHVVRCLALAEMIITNFDISFAIQNPSTTVVNTIHSVTNKILSLPLTDDYNHDANNFVAQLNGNEIVVLDGYCFTTDYQRAIKNKGCKLVVIDDLHSWHHLADAIINHAEGIDKSMYSAEQSTKYYLGLNYILLRKEFLQAYELQRDTLLPSKLFISMGAADEHNNTLKFAEALVQINYVNEINIMLSALNKHCESIELLATKQSKIKLHYNLNASQLVNLLQHCDVSICPASSISLESCAIGTTLITGYTANNQLGNLAGLNKHKVCFDLGNFNSLTQNEIKNKVESILSETEIQKQFLFNQRTMIDRKSPERVLNVFKALNGDG